MALALTAAFAAPGAAWSGEFNNRILATGERASGLGGAFVALADDDTGMLYNPAGLVHADHTAPSATVNVVSASRTRYDDVFGSVDWTRDSVGVVPSFFGASMPGTDGWVYGASLVVLDFYSEDQRDVFDDVQIGPTEWDELRVHNDSTGKALNAGLTFAHAFADSGWSVGLTTYFHYAERNRSYSQRLSEATPNDVRDARTVQVQVNADDESMGLRPVLGLQYRNEKISVGLAVSRLFTFHRDYFYAFAATATDRANPENENANFTFDLIDETDDRESQPWHLSAGLALSLSERSKIAFQLDHFTSRETSSADEVSRGVQPRDLDMQAVTNFAVGVETSLTPDWAMRVGLYSDFANNKSDEAVAFERREEIDVYGLAFSLSKRRERGYWTVGVDVAHGDGDATLGDVGFGAAAGGQRVEASKSAFNLLLSTTW